MVPEWRGASLECRFRTSSFCASNTFLERTPFSYTKNTRSQFPHKPLPHGTDKRVLRRCDALIKRFALLRNDFDELFAFNALLFHCFDLDVRQRLVGGVAIEQFTVVRARQERRV
jgi:hypothetical protein